MKLSFSVLSSIMLVLSVLISSCSNEKHQLEVLEPQWKASMDTVFSTQKLLTSRSNFVASRVKEMDENHIYTRYLDTTTQRYFDSLQQLEQIELMVATMLNNTFQRIVKGTEEHDLKLTLLRKAVSEKKEHVNVTSLSDSTVILCDSLKNISAKYKLSISQSHSVASNLYQTYKSRLDQEIADFNAKAKSLNGK